MQRTTVAAAVAVVAVLGGASAFAAATADDGAIHACKHTKRGIVRILRTGASCKRNESAVSWSIRGPQGEPGAQGAQGPKGDPGPQGSRGPAGGGITSLGALAGLDCTTFDNEPGKVDLDITPENLVLVSCDSPDAPPDGGGDGGGGGTGGGAGKLVVNEVDYDQVGADTGGFVEIANTGDVDASLTGVALVLVNGGDGAEYQRVALTGTLAAGAYLKVDVDPQNGAPDGLALVAGATLLDALSYEGEIHAATIGGASHDLVEGTPLPATVVDSNTAEGTLARIPDGRDTNDAAADWRFTTTPTPGAANTLTP